MKALLSVLLNVVLTTLIIAAILQINVELNDYKAKRRAAFNTCLERVELQNFPKYMKMKECREVIKHEWEWER